MRYILDSARAMVTAMRSALRSPTTVQFPAQIRERPERYRTSFALLHDEHGEELCIGCLACERICPSTVIKVRPGPKCESPVTGKKRGTCEDLTLDVTGCLVCELCVQVCPTDALVMLRVPDLPGYSREDLVLTMDKLYANEKSKPLTWGTGSRLMSMQEPPKQPRQSKAPPAGADAPGPAKEAAR